MLVSPQRASLATGAVLASVACFPTADLSRYRAGGGSGGGDALAGGLNAGGSGSAAEMDASSGLDEDAGSVDGSPESGRPEIPSDAGLDAAAPDPMAPRDAGGPCSGEAGTTTSFQSETSCFLLVDEAIGWAEALGACEAWGGSLATVTSPEEEATVDAARGEVAIWIGYNDRGTEGTYTWASGETSDHTNWNLAAAQPTNADTEDCVAKLAGAGTWFDLQCTDLYAYLCERPL